jgi:hypothetical protein
MEGKFPLYERFSGLTAQTVYSVLPRFYIAKFQFSFPYRGYLFSINVRLLSRLALINYALSLFFSCFILSE